jgi:hypothetical protein
MLSLRNAMPSASDKNNSTTLKRQALIFGALLFLLIKKNEPKEKGKRRLTLRGLGFCLRNPS